MPELANPPTRRAIPKAEPYLSSLVKSITAVKEAVEIVTGQTNDLYSAAPTWGQLLDAGVITEDQLRALGIVKRTI